MKICPDCGYFNEEKYDEYSPYPGECEDCYRYEICLDAARKENKMINANDLYYDDNEAIKFIKKKRDWVRRKRNRESFGIGIQIYAKRWNYRGGYRL